MSGCSASACWSWASCSGARGPGCWPWSARSSGSPTPRAGWRSRSPLAWSLAVRLAGAGARGSASGRCWRRPAAGSSGSSCHPNLPNNFWLLWTQNVIVPLASVGAETRSLREALGVELQRRPCRGSSSSGRLSSRPSWPWCCSSAGRRRARPRPSPLAALSLAFLLAGAFLLRRLVEIGAVLGILAAGARRPRTERARRSGPRPPRGAGPRRRLDASGSVRDFGRGDLRPLGNARPLAMAEFLGENGRPGDLVFTAQWADSAPLFYAAPQLKSLVALDPTFFYAKDPQLFDRYWAIAHGRSGDPVGEIAAGDSAPATSRSGRPRASGRWPFSCGATGGRGSSTKTFYEVWGVSLRAANHTAAIR